MKTRTPQIIARLDETVEEALDAGAKLIVEDAQARVPVGATGNLKASIHVERVSTGAGVGGSKNARRVVAWSDDAWYGHIVENGGAYTSPKPFLLPAVEAKRNEVEKRVRAAMKRLADTGR